MRGSLRVVAQASNQRGKVRPEDKMATNSQNGDIITLSPPYMYVYVYMYRYMYKYMYMCIYIYLVIILALFPWKTLTNTLFIDISQGVG
jgi:hypothetical protein